MFNLSICRTDSGALMVKTAQASYLMLDGGGCFGFIRPARGAAA